MANQNGTIWVTQDGCNCMQSGFAMRNGQLIQRTNPQAPNVTSVREVRQRQGNILLSTAAWADLYAQQVNAGASGLNNTYGLADQPGRGASDVVRTAVPGSPVGIPTSTYTVKFDNTGGGATADTRYLGDWAQSWQLKNPPPAASPGLTISGSYGANSVSHLTQRMANAALAVKSIQVIANNQDYYGSNSLAYIDTKPNGSNPTFLPYDLATLVNAEQYNPTIQSVDTPILFDGISALQVNIPANRIVTLNLEIISEGRGRSMLLLNS